VELKNHQLSNVSMVFTFDLAAELHSNIYSIMKKSHFCMTTHDAMEYLPAGACRYLVVIEVISATD